MRRLLDLPPGRRARRHPAAAGGASAPDPGGHAPAPTAARADGDDRTAAEPSTAATVPARRITGRRLATLASAVVTLALSTGGAFAAFSAVSSNGASTFASGDVVLTDDDEDAALFDLSARSGTTRSACIRVRYQGSLPARVSHGATVTGTLGPYLGLVVTRGSGTTGTGASASDCTGFQAETTNHIGAGAGVVYDGTIAGFPTAPDPTAAEEWTAGRERTYRFTVTLGADAAAEGRTAGSTFRWTATGT